MNLHAFSKVGCFCLSLSIILIRYFHVDLVVVMGEETKSSCSSLKTESVREDSKSKCLTHPAIHVK